MQDINYLIEEIEKCIIFNGHPYIGNLEYVIDKLDGNNLVAKHIRDHSPYEQSLHLTMYLTALMLRKIEKDKQCQD